MKLVTRTGLACLCLSIYKFLCHSKSVCFLFWLDVLGLQWELSEANNSSMSTVYMHSAQKPFLVCRVSSSFQLIRNQICFWISLFLRVGCRLSLFFLLLLLLFLFFLVPPSLPIVRVRWGLIALDVNNNYTDWATPFPGEIFFSWEHQVFRLFRLFIIFIWSYLLTCSFGRQDGFRTDPDQLWYWYYYFLKQFLIKTMLFSHPILLTPTPTAIIIHS